MSWQIILLDDDGPFFPVAEMETTAYDGMSYQPFPQPITVMLINAGQSQLHWRLCVRGPFGGNIFWQRWSCVEEWRASGFPGAKPGQREGLRVCFEGLRRVNDIGQYRLLLTDPRGIWDFCVKLNYTTPNEDTKMFPRPTKLAMK